jgi:uncharacterized membrane protein YqjE
MRPREQVGDPDHGGFSTYLGQLADGLSKLVAQHLELARLEISEDLRAVGTNLAKIAAFIPFMLVGYLLLCCAVAFLLARVVSTDAAFAIVGGVNLIGGALGAWRAAQSIKKRPMMDDSLAELRNSAAAFGQDETPPMTKLSERSHGA